MLAKAKFCNEINVVHHQGLKKNAVKNVQQCLTADPVQE